MLTLRSRVTPPITPNPGDSTFFVDATDNKLKVKKSDGTIVEIDVSTEIDRTMKIHNGFENRLDSIMTLNDSTRTLTLTPASTSFVVWSGGKRYEFTGPVSIQIPATEGDHTVYFGPDGNLTALLGFDERVITEWALVAHVYWDADTNKSILLLDERHGMMDGNVHFYLHTVFGAQWLSGGDISGIIADGDGSLASHYQFQVSPFMMRDEDILFAADNGLPQTLSPIAMVPIFFKQGSSSGPNWRRKDPTVCPFINAGSVPGYTGTTPAFNELVGDQWQLTAVTSGNFFLVHYFITPDLRYPFLGVVGEAQYTSIGAARAAADDELSVLVTNFMPFPEWAVMGSVIFEVNSAYANPCKARIRSVDDGSAYINWKKKKFERARTFGMEVQYATSDAVSTTTSSAYQNKLTLTTQSVASGSYLVFWSFGINNSNANVRSFYRVTQNNNTSTPLAEAYEDSPSPSSGSDFQTVTGYAILPVMSGVNTFKLDYKAAANTARICNARIVVWRLI